MTWRSAWYTDTKLLCVLTCPANAIQNAQHLRRFIHVILVIGRRLPPTDTSLRYEVQIISDDERDHCVWCNSTGRIISQHIDHSLKDARLTYSMS